MNVRHQLMFNTTMASCTLHNSRYSKRLRVKVSYSLLLNADMFVFGGALGLIDGAPSQYHPWCSKCYRSEVSWHVASL